MEKNDYSDTCEIDKILNRLIGDASCEETLVDLRDKIDAAIIRREARIDELEDELKSLSHDSLKLANKAW